MNNIYESFYKQKEALEERALHVAKLMNIADPTISLYPDSVDYILFHKDSISVYSSYTGSYSDGTVDSMSFPVSYLSLEDEEIKNITRKEREERESTRLKNANQRKEEIQRSEYERLKRIYEKDK